MIDQCSLVSTKSRRGWINFEIDPAQLPRAGEDARKMVGALRNLLAPCRIGSRIAQCICRAMSAGLPDWAEHLIDPHRDKNGYQRPRAGVAQFALSYEPHAGCFFDGEDPLDLMRHLPQVLLSILSRENLGRR